MRENVVQPNKDLISEMHGDQEFLDAWEASNNKVREIVNAWASIPEKDRDQALEALLLFRRLTANNRDLITDEIAATQRS